MRNKLILLLAVLCYCGFGAAESANADDTTKTRLIVMADMGNEPDEEQQMMHLLLYANRIDLEGLIACSGKYLHADREDGRTKTRPDLFHKLVDGYEKVVHNLSKHELGWPTAESLRGLIQAGTAGYGIDAVEAGKSNEASRLIEAAIERNDSRKLYVVCNAGANTLAQALVDLELRHDKSAMSKFCRNLIVFENGAQDNAGAWIAGRYPDIAWHRSNHQTYAYGGPGEATGPYTWEPFERSPDGQNEWAEKHVMRGHGALGECFPPRIMWKRLHFLEGGGTIPWMGLVNHGLTDPEHLEWGGWSGRFSREKHGNVFSRHADIRKDERSYPPFEMYEADSEIERWTDPVHEETFENHFVPVWRFRRAMYRDFQARMDWCLETPGDANHQPIASVNGDASDRIMHINAEPGQVINLDASHSKDPDGNPVQFQWWHYQEAGTYPNLINLSETNEAELQFQVPEDGKGSEIHVILSLEDEHPSVPMTDYRRVVVSVQ